MKYNMHIDDGQHIGIPTDCFDKTVSFYQDLGFELEHQVDNSGQKVGFLRFNHLQLEIYEEKVTAQRAGAIDHIALNCTDIDAAYKTAKEAGFKILSNNIEALPFWQNGIKFLIIEGPNKERVEFCQIL